MYLHILYLFHNVFHLLIANYVLSLIETYIIKLSIILYLIKYVTSCGRDYVDIIRCTYQMNTYTFPSLLCPNQVLLDSFVTWNPQHHEVSHKDRHLFTATIDPYLEKEYSFISSWQWKLVSRSILDFTIIICFLEILTRLC